MTEPMIGRTPGVLQRSLEGEYVLYHPGTDEAMVLDLVGSVVWDALETATTRTELVEALADRFGEPVDRIAADVAPLLDGLLAAQLIRIDGEDQRLDEG